MRRSQRLFTSFHEELDANTPTTAVDSQRLLILQKCCAAVRPVQDNINNSAAAVRENMKPSSLPDTEYRCIVLLVKFLLRS
jgi:hypothetical protein